MPIQPTAKIWHNGNLVPWDKAQIHVMSHVVHDGLLVFEGIRCYANPRRGRRFFGFLNICSDCWIRPRFIVCPCLTRWSSYRAQWWAWWRAMVLLRAT